MAMNQRRNRCHNRYINTVPGVGVSGHGLWAVVSVRVFVTKKDKLYVKLQSGQFLLTLVIFTYRIFFCMFQQAGVCVGKCLKLCYFHVIRGPYVGAIVRESLLAESIIKCR